VIPSLGYNLTKGLYVVLPLVTKVTLGGVMLFEYIPRIGIRL